MEVSILQRVTRTPTMAYSRMQRSRSPGPPYRASPSRGEGRKSRRHHGPSRSKVTSRLIQTVLLPGSNSHGAVYRLTLPPALQFESAVHPLFFDPAQC